MHTSSKFKPARAADESQSDYRERQAQARDAAQRMTLTGHHRADGGKSSREQQRDAARKSGRMSKRRRYADIVMAWFASRAKEAKAASSR